jgi:protein-S-isoprenylcysteine O-methyltransferase Ste14
VLPIVLALVFARPTTLTWAVGGGAMLLGEALRLWAAAWIGPAARTSRVNTTRLLTRGPYGRMRHPLYLGNLFLTVGFAAASGAGWPWFPAVAGLGFVALYAGHARREERALAAAFPEAWSAYAGRVPAMGWRTGSAPPPGVGEPSGPSLRRALATEALTLNAEFWLVVALWARGRFA